MILERFCVDKMVKSGSFAKNAISLTTSKVLTNVITLISAMLLARIRTLEEYGTYSELILIVNLTASIFMLGLPNSVNFFLAKAKTIQEKNRFLSLYYTISTTLSFVLGIILVVLVPIWIRYFKNDKIAEYTFFLLIFPWERIITSSVENVLVVLNKSKTIVIYRISNCLVLLGIIFFVWAANASFRTYMVLYILVEGAYSLAMYFLSSKYTGKLHLYFDRSFTKQLMNFSIPMGLASIVGTLNIELDKLMLGYLLTANEFAVYANASKELPLTILATALTAVLMPKMVQYFEQGKNREAVEVWRDVTTISYAIVAFFAFGMATFATEAMTILYSEKYASGGPVFAVYSLGLLLKCTYFGIVLNSSGRTKIILCSAIGTLVCNVFFNFVLYRIFGVVGPALATILSNLIMNLCQLYFSSKVIGMPFSLIFPWGNICRLTLLNIGLGLVFAMVHKILFPGNIQAVVLATMWGIVYTLALFVPGKEYWKKIKGV